MYRDELQALNAIYEEQKRTNQLLERPVVSRRVRGRQSARSRRFRTQPKGQDPQQMNVLIEKLIGGINDANQSHTAAELPEGNSRSRSTKTSRKTGS
ncbi:hypothetical protein QP794_27180 [Paenibacillus sp. UMB7766-LJ446]|uniref:hypothetical protein n=1 Tax=Paenibacillus sp. UMB7766-LJ446 TaxID=3046313 RepID=UPI002551465B|nr:hypothetical protein [Paenibacillus sp. UMB7766-LJ446]MDK8193770.1 hypothetical protein [Paenibacillus sp. UMB7766-LJ446]